VAILPYSDYLNLNRVRGYLTMQEIYRGMGDSGITAREIYRESRQELEGSS
jgi:hypothetical protein